MPKVVDHDARRREITGALWRLAAREGLEAASLASVAAEAGVSKGRVQHYFASRDELLAFAASALRERLGARVRARVAAAGEDPLAVVRALLAGLLPLDAEARVDALVGSAFLVRAIADPTARAQLRTGEEEILAALADGLAALPGVGTRAPRPRSCTPSSAASPTPCWSSGTRPTRRSGARPPPGGAVPPEVTPRGLGARAHRRGPHGGLRARTRRSPGRRSPTSDRAGPGPPGPDGRVSRTAA